MDASAIAALLLSIAASQPAVQQRAPGSSQSLAIVAGAAGSTLSSSNPNDDFGFGSGPAFGVILATGRGRWAAQTEAIVGRRTAINRRPSGRRDSWRIWTLEVPVVARWRLLANVHVVGGASLDLRLASSIDQGVGVRGLDEETKAFGLGWTVGGVVMKRRIVLEARYLAGLRNVAQDFAPTIHGTLRPRSFLLIGGIFLR